MHRMLTKEEWDDGIRLEMDQKILSWLSGYWLCLGAICHFKSHDCSNNALWIMIFARNWFPGSHNGLAWCSATPVMTSFGHVVTFNSQLWLQRLKIEAQNEDTSISCIKCLPFLLCFRYNEILWTVIEPYMFTQISTVIKVMHMRVLSCWYGGVDLWIYSNGINA